MSKLQFIQNKDGMRFNHLLLSFLFIPCFLFLITSCEEAPSSLELPALFSDHMVLQQQSDCPIWGTAGAGANIAIQASWGGKVKVKADAKGNWQTNLKSPAAGGPFDIKIQQGDSIISITDVMIGEVWLCSGQSNMEMSLEGWPPTDLIDNSEAEIAAANYPAIRMFTVGKVVAAKPLKDLTGSWELCNPENAAGFSATAYFFAKNLYDSLGIPIGLLHSSWGGTPAEAWTEGKHLAELNEFQDIATEVQQAKADFAVLETWLENKEKIDNRTLPSEQQWENLDFKDAALLSNQAYDQWPKMNLPGYWENAALKGFDGVVLFHRKLQVPKDWLGEGFVMNLGAIDDMDECYVNGQKVGGMMGRGFWNKPRAYEIPAGLLHEGENDIVIRVVDTGGGGGFSGAEYEMSLLPQKISRIYKSLPLSGEWSYLPIAKYFNGQFYLFGGNLAAFQEMPQIELAFDAHTPTSLYNGMIAPLAPYRIKGTIWYQGESNVGEHELYEKLFPTMIESWRHVWKQGDFPFYFVQIAPYHYGEPTGIFSAQLREAQRKSLSVPNTGMVVTLDISNIDNIHPGNKQDIGKRLALWALAHDYGYEDLVFSGPLVNKISMSKGKALLDFLHSKRGLTSTSESLTGFEIAGEDGLFLPAQAVILGKQVLVWHNGVPEPTQVRYAFTNASEGILFNGEGLPASSFWVSVP